MASEKRKKVVLSTEQKLETLKRLDKGESMQKKKLHPNSVCG
jgi:hypothetical protein